MLFLYYLTGVFICISIIFFGHMISKEIYNPVIYILFWVVYIITVLTISNSLFNIYTYLSINKKEAPPGEKGPQGETGDDGEDGECDSNSKLNIYISKVLKELDKHYNIILNNANENKNLGSIEPRTINNKYIKDTLKRIFKSKQFKEVAQTQNVSKLINYITEIFKRWLEILANADKSEGKKHFRDYMEICGDRVQWEFITNPDNNPFNEIEKYDVYYWGLNKEFHPIKLKACQKQKEVKQNFIRAMKTNLYKETYNDKGTGGKKSLSVWLSDPITIDGDTFYPLGSVFHPNRNPSSFKKTVQQIGNFANPLQNDVYGMSKTPNMTNVLVSKNDSKMVRQPPSYAWSWKWNDKKTGGKKSVTFWNAEDFYEDGELYRCFGSMTMPNKKNTNPTQQLGRNNVPIVCLNDKIVDQVQNRHNFVWDDKGTGGSYSSSAYANLDGLYNLGYFTKGRGGPDYNRKSFKIKDEVLNNNDAKYHKKIVSLDEKNLSSPEIGYQNKDYDFDRNRKDSIFDLLDLVIKSDIENFNFNKKLKIEHSGLNDPNSYLIKERNLKCLKINENDNMGNSIELATCNSTKSKQLWELEFLEQSKELCLIKSKDNDKYLYLINPSKYALKGDIPSRNINNKDLKPFIWKIITK